MDQTFAWFSLDLSQKRIFFAKFFGENIFKIISSVPVKILFHRYLILRDDILIGVRGHLDGQASSQYGLTWKNPSRAESWNYYADLWKFKIKGGAKCRLFPNIEPHIGSVILVA
jgi:hypothetical protein